MSRPKRAEMLHKYGHAGGHLRDALLNALDYNEEWWHNIEISFIRERHNLWWSRLSAKKRAGWLLGQLWNCTDVVPGLTRLEVKDWLPDDPDPSTYAWLVRLLKRDLDSQIEPNPDGPEDEEARKQLDREEQRFQDRKEQRLQDREEQRLQDREEQRLQDREEQRLVDREEQRLLDREEPTVLDRDEERPRG
jgi:hypothetical protein